MFSHNSPSQSECSDPILCSGKTIVCAERNTALLHTWGQSLAVLSKLFQEGTITLAVLFVSYGVIQITLTHG